MPDCIIREDGSLCISWLFHMDTVMRRLIRATWTLLLASLKCRRRWHLSPQQWIGRDKLQRTQLTLPNLNRKGIYNRHGSWCQTQKASETLYTDLPKPTAKSHCRTGPPSSPPPSGDSRMKQRVATTSVKPQATPCLPHAVSCPLSVHPGAPTSAADG